MARKKMGHLVAINEPQNEVAISVRDVSKSFKLPHNRQNSIKGGLINLLNGDRSYEIQDVLKSISFDVKKGEFFGIVGRNGSGKSTLLKMMSGIYTPTEGTIIINGSLTPFIELGVGFNPELTGRENVFLNGALLGFNRDEIAKMYDGIVEFAELERFMDQKLKNYSSGMQVRLAFSIAIRARSEILILDEVLAVGDEAFQRKCYSYFAELKRNKKTVILVTHSMDSVQQFCNRALLIDKGKIMEVGNPAIVAGKYLDLNDELGNVATQSKQPMVEKNKDVSAKVGVSIVKDFLTFNIVVFAKKEIKDMVVTFIINKDTGEKIYRWASDDNGARAINLSEGERLAIKLQIDNIFPDGEFDIQLGVKKKDRSLTYALMNRIAEFRLVNPIMEKRDAHWKPKTVCEIELGQS